MLIGLVKGYQVGEISKRKAGKANFGEGLENVISKEELQREALEALQGKGRVFALYSQKDKLLKACYILERVRMNSGEIPYQRVRIDAENLWEFVTTGTVSDEEDKDIVGGKAAWEQESLNLENSEESHNGVEDKEIWVYKLTSSYSECVEDEAIHNFEKAILQELKEAVVSAQIDAAFSGENLPEAIIWKDKTLRTSKIKAGSYGYVNALPIGLGIGTALGVTLDNIAMGICLGLLWSVVFGVQFTTNERKGGDE